MEKKIRIYYDGLCNLCISSVDAIEHSGRSQIFETIDVTNNEPPRGITRHEAMQHVYAMDAGGRLYKGADAVLRIMEEYPHLRLWVKVGRLPGIRQVAAFFYWLVARNRYWMFGRKKV